MTGPVLTKGKVLVFNCGSSSLKCKLFQVDREARSWADRVLASVAVERIGGASSIGVSIANEQHMSTAHAVIPDHSAAVEAAFDALDRLDSFWRDGLAATGHRVVHGGRRFREPTLIDGDTIAEIEFAGDMAPLHNAPALKAISRTRTVLGSQLPAVAVFDTAFHTTMPAYAAQYAIPYDLAARNGIHRYGFHGIAHRSMVEQFVALGDAERSYRLVTLQLGNGCSAAAVKDGMCLDTSMGLTPLEGLMMGTRSGDIDPAVIPLLARQEGVAAEEVEQWLNSRSGLLGVSGRSADIRDLLIAERGGDERASLALDMFCYRVRKYVGAYAAVLGGLDSIVFGGGIGENSHQIRARICAGMEWMGLTLDEARNDSALAAGGRISDDRSRTQAYVFNVDEERLIARDAFELLQSLR